LENNSFRFKQFVVHHDRATHKVGTDAVLLGAWVNTTGVQSALDIGTGSGVIALMVAQRTSSLAKIDAVDIEQNNFLQAAENIAGSPWPEKIRVHHATVQEFFPQQKFDLIVSNPPYFVNSLLPVGSQRRKARHTTSLSYNELLTAVKRLLMPSGKFGVILPTSEGDQFQSIAMEFGLYCSRRLAFFSRKQKPQERWLVEFTFTPADPFTETLVLYHEGNKWSDEYKTLTGDFYLLKADRRPVHNSSKSN